MIGMDLSLCLLSNSCLCTDHIWVFSTSFKYFNSQVRGKTVCYVAMHVTLCTLGCAQSKYPPPTFLGEDLGPSHSTAVSCTSFILKYDGKHISNVLWTPSTKRLVHSAMYLQRSVLARWWYGSHINSFQIFLFSEMNTILWASTDNIHYFQ